MNECENGGYIVGAHREVPSDPTDFMWIGRNPTVGCSRLRCSVCGLMVKQHGGWRVDRDQVQYGTPDYRPRIDQLLSEDNWDLLPFMRHDENYRVYVCRCGFVMEDHQQGTELTEIDGMGSPTIPWRCSGHPLVSLPFALDGITFSTLVDLVDAARRAFSGWRPESCTDEVQGTWASRLHGRVSGTEMASKLEELTVACLRDPDARVRAGALRSLRRQRNAAGFRVAADMALDGPPDPAAEVQQELTDAVARFYEFDVLDEPRLRDWARSNALRPGVRQFVLEALAERDPSWLRDSAEAVVRANPQEAGFVLKSVFNAFLSKGYTPFELAAKLARIPGVSHEQMRSDARRWLRGDSRDGVLKILDSHPDSAN